MKDLSLHMLDILQNSVSAGASLISIRIDERPDENLYGLVFTDNGKGMDEKTIKQVTDPFFTTRTTRKVGLGLPLLKQNAERTGGNLKIESVPGKETIVSALFSYSHIDRLPTGDIPGIMALTVSSFPAIDFLYEHHTNEGTFKFDTKEIKETLGEVPVNNPQVISFIKDLIRDNLRLIKAS